MPARRFRADDAFVLVIDVQEKLLAHIADGEAVERQVQRLLDGAAVLDLPVLATEQYRKGLGDTVPAVKERLSRAACVEEKLLFSACVKPVTDAARELGRRSVLVCGIEAHVCVLQTCLDLMDLGYHVGLVVDAVGSRRTLDRDAAISRLTQAGVTPTTVESALLEMVGEAGTPRFKAMLPVIK